MKRVAWILYGSLEQRTGGTIYDAHIVNGLRARGIEVEVLSIARGDSPAPLLRRLAERRPDVIVGDELCHRELAFLFSRVSFAKRVLLVHHLTCWEEELAGKRALRARFFEAIALRHADLVIATSHATRARLVGEGCRTPIEVVTCGADRLPLLPRAGHADGGARFVFVGAVIPRKRVRELVEAFASVPAPATLRIIGRRDADPAYAAAIPVADRVTFAGEVDEAALARELAAADALVMPSSLEGYGIAATEAVRAGVPVIAARGPGLAEALAPCPEAVTFVPSDSLVISLASAMRELALDAGARRSFRAAAVAAASRLPTWDSAALAFASLVA